MGKRKTTQQSTQTNTYAYQTPPETADVTALRGMKAQVDPSIPYRYAKGREEYDNSWKNPLGSATSPAVREAASRVTNQRLAMDEGNTMSAAQNEADNTNFSRQAAIAGMTAPQLVQTGGTMNGTTTQTGGFWSGLLQSAVGGASSAATAAAM